MMAMLNGISWYGLYDAETSEVNMISELGKKEVFLRGWN